MFLNNNRAMSDNERDDMLNKYHEWGKEYAKEVDKVVKAMDSLTRSVAWYNPENDQPEIMTDALTREYKN